MTEKEMQIEYWPLEKLVPYVRNPRKNEGAVNDLVIAIKEYGFRVPVVAKSDGTVVDGHLRLKAAIKLGMATVPVINADDMTEAQIKAFRISVNRMAELAEWDFDLLKLELEDLKELDFDLELTGLDGDMVKDLLNAIEGTEGKTDPDEVPEPPAEPVTRSGDLYLLGRHRLLCGDSTNITDVERLMDGKKADMVFTDPPWNVNYGEVEKNNAQGCKPRQIMNDNMGREDWAEFLNGVVGSLITMTKPGALLYCVMGSSEWPAIDAALRGGGFHWSSTIIWAKDSLILSRKDYHTQYEPIWYGWNEAAGRLVPILDRTQSDLWECKRPKVSELHPTTKPVELIERAILNSSKSGDILMELFGGSGSTLIACEKTGRTCYGMELDPQYCDVIVARWEKFTGKKAERVTDAD